MTNKRHLAFRVKTITRKLVKKRVGLNESVKIFNRKPMPKNDDLGNA